jgi:hypothetical protein
MIMLISLPAILSIFLAACQPGWQKSAFPAEIADAASFKLSAAQAEYGSGVSQIEFIIGNSSDGEAIYGAEYALDVFRQDAWYTVPFKGVKRKTQPTWNALAYLLPAHDTGSIVINLANHENVSPGSYRLIKKISLKSGDQKTFVLVAHFVIR